MFEIDNKTFNKVTRFNSPQLFAIQEFTHVYDIVEHGLFCAKFRGSLLTLFGKPVADTKDLEDGIYEYNIKCIDNLTGDIIYFHITEVRLGPLISTTDNLLSSKNIGQKLWNKILVTSPSDFNAKYFDDENTLKVYYGYKNSSPYFDLKSFNIFDYVLRFSRIFISMLNYTIINKIYK